MRLTLYFVIIVLLNFFQNNLYSQSRRIDSLKRELLVCKEDTTKMKLLGLMAIDYMGTKPDTAIVLCSQALTVAEKLALSSNDLIAKTAKKRRAHCDHQIGTLFYSKGEYVLALDYLQKAILLWESLMESSDATLAKYGKSGKAKSMLIIGNVYQEQANYPKALEYYTNALKLAEEQGLMQLQAGILGNIGIIYYYENQRDKALSYYQKALKMAELLGDEAQVSGHYNNIGTIYEEQGLLSKALEYFFKGLKLDEERNDKHGKAIKLGNIGNLYLSQADSIVEKNISSEELTDLYSKSIEYFNKALNLMEDLGDQYGIAINKSRLGSVYKRTARYQLAEENLKEAIKLSHEIEATDLIMSAENELTRVYDTTGRHQLAFEHYKKFIALRDTIDSEENQKKLVRTEMNYEFEKKEAVMKEEQEKERVVAEEKSRFQKVVIWSVAFGLILVLVFAGFVFRSLKITRKQKIVIEEKQREILDSIHYAKRIQSALMTNEKYFEKSINKLQTKKPSS